MTSRTFIVDVTLDSTGESGRIFTRSLGQLTKLAPSVEDVLAQRFADEDDRARLPALRDILEQSRTVTVEAYRGETAPYEMHVYFVANDLYRFACVLVPPDLLAQFLDDPNAAVCESATMQIIDDVSEAAIVAGLGRWCRRLWPGLRVPNFFVTAWPARFDEEDGAVELMNLFPLASAASESRAGDFTKADMQFAPPSNLSGKAA